MQVYLEIKGIPELVKQLNGAEQKILKQMLRRGLREAAKPVLKMAKALVPYSGGVKWGVKEKKVKGKGTITELTKKTHLRDLLGIRSMKRRKNRIAVLVGTSSAGFTGKGFYGAFLELGTEKMAARSFLRRAFDSNREISEAILRNELNAALDSITTVGALREEGMLSLGMAYVAAEGKWTGSLAKEPSLPVITWGEFSEGE